MHACFELKNKYKSSKKNQLKRPQTRKIDQSRRYLHKISANARMFGQISTKIPRSELLNENRRLTTNCELRLDLASTRLRLKKCQYNVNRDK